MLFCPVAYRRLRLLILMPVHHLAWQWSSPAWTMTYWACHSIWLPCLWPTCGVRADVVLSLHQH